MLSPFLPILELLSRNTRQPSRYALLPRAQPRTKRILARLSPGVGSSFGDWSPLSSLSLPFRLHRCAPFSSNIFSLSLTVCLSHLRCQVSPVPLLRNERIDAWKDGQLIPFTIISDNNLWYGLQDGKNFLGAWLTVRVLYYSSL